MTVKKTTVKRGRKFEQVITGARTIFLRDGFEGASVDDIAREASVSKATLYSYFSDKRTLFTETAMIEAQRQTENYEQNIDMSLPPVDILTAAGRKLQDYMLSEFGMAMYRIAVAEAERFPEFAERYYGSGPQLARDTLAGYLEICIERGELAIPDVTLAAGQFMELCKVCAVTKCTFCPPSDLSKAERHAIIDSAVAMFMSHYGVTK